MSSATGLFGAAFFAMVFAAGAVHADSPAIHESQGVRYVSGGVGEDERAALEAVQDQFNLLLTFAVKGGAFLSAVEVGIQDRSGATVLQAVSDGPYFYTALPTGTYVVTASLDGQSSRRTITIAGGRSVRASFFW